MIDIVLNWGLNAYSGWGLVGVNLAGLLAHDKDFNLIVGCPFENSHVASMDQFRYQNLHEVRKRSMAWQHTQDCIWIDPVGNDVRGTETEARVKVARVILEKADMRQAMDNLASYDLLLTGSTWCQEKIESATGRDVKLILEGIDPSMFYPGLKSGWTPEAFYIFAAGKVEYRKAQDVVMQAFKRFSERHADARLVTMWNSPYTDLANGFRGNLEHPLWLKENGQLDVKRWAKDNGIDAEKVYDLGSMPNFCIPPILREMDVMLSPTRVESCTCLPVMEAMACGIPVIAAKHTGMNDLLTHGNSLPLTDLKEIEGSREYFFPLADWAWYEPNLEEIDYQLEWVYQHRLAARELGNSASGWIRANRTWEQHVRELKRWLK